MAETRSEKIAVKFTITRRDAMRMVDLARADGQTIQDTLRRLVAFYLLVNSKPDITDAEVVEKS
jgi:hypothetical protein